MNFRIKRVVKLCPALLASLALLISSAAANSRAGEKAATLEAFAELFGPPVDERESLFEVNTLFVLRPKYDSHGRLVELAVFPKYWLEETHPEWTEPPKASLLAKSEYAELLGRLESVKPKGELISAGMGSVITNMTEYFLDRYGRAFVRRGERASDGVRFFEVYYSHEIEGKVEKKRASNSFGERFYQVLVGEFVYCVRAEDFSRLRTGRVEKFSAVGPIKGQCLGGYCNP